MHSTSSDRDPIPQRTNQELIPQLPDEVWKAIATHLNPQDLARTKYVSSQHRRVVRDVMCGVAPSSSLPWTCDQGELRAALALSPQEAEKMPHTGGKRNTEYVFLRFYTRVYNIKTYLPYFISHMGGWLALKERLNVVESKKRKRCELETRREKARIKRVCRLDDWFKSKLPFGNEINSLDSWIKSLRARFASHPKTDATLRAFLESGRLRGPSISAAKAAVVQFEKTQTKRLERARKCTRPGCKNVHRRVNPVTGPNGPVCGSCAREMFCV